MEDWEAKHYAFFQNRDCEYFPCHKVKDEENFNCLFCYCPLYALGSNAAAISAIRKTASRTAPAAPCRTERKTTEESRRNSNRSYSL